MIASAARRKSSGRSSRPISIVRIGCEILRRLLHVAAAAEVAEYRWQMRLSGQIRRCGIPNGDDEARWVVAIGRPQEA